LHCDAGRPSIAGMTTVPPLVLSAPLQAAGVSLSPVGEADRPFLQQLYRLVRWDEFASAGWPDQMLATFLDSQFEMQRRGYEAGHPDCEFYVVWRGETPIGRLFIDRSGPDLELVEISLLPEWRGKGLGSDFLALLQDEVRAGRCERVRLEVTPENPARRLYQRMGFVEPAPASPYAEAYIEMVWPSEITA
jgi:ribosomal protein S18 acetylase RimI-like enzyme